MFKAVILQNRMRHNLGRKRLCLSTYVSERLNLPVRPNNCVINLKIKKFTGSWSTSWDIGRKGENVSEQH